MCLIMLLTLVALFAPARASSLPIVDPGLFVISGVKTCGDGEGYCLLGSDCSLDQDFTEDISGHCGGLRGAFTPSANFVCCTGSKKENEVEQDLGKLNISKIPPDVEVDLTTEALLTTTMVKEDYLIMETETNVTSESDYDDLTRKGEKCDSCNSTVKFFIDDVQLCLGSHIGNGWFITSASCSVKIFRAGMVNVRGHFGEEDFLMSVKTIVVHENYRTTISNILLPELFNLGLIEINETSLNHCAYCLPEEDQVFAGQLCNTFDTSDDISICESEVETMQGEGKEEFLTLACDAPAQPKRFGEEPENGRPLTCGSYLAGVETSSGVGITVFTQLSLYSKWIKQSIQTSPEQLFRTNSD